MATGVDPCPACGATLVPTGRRCEGCGGSITCHVRLDGSPFRVRPLAQRVAIGYGLGPDAISVDDEGLVVSGTPAATGAVAIAAEVAGISSRRWIEHRPSRRRWLVLGFAALVLALAAGGWLLRGSRAPAPDDPTALAGYAGQAPGEAAPVDDTDPDPPPDGGTADGMPTDAMPTDAMPADAMPADAMPAVHSTGPAIDPAVVRTTVRSTVHLLADRRMGAGIIVSAEGHVLTNAHVVGLDAMVRVSLHDGTVVPGRVVDHRRAEDLALVLIESPTPLDLRPIPIGEATRLKLADPVFVIGSPLGHDFSVTRGYVAHTRRWLAHKPCIQFDAPIERGNSGGPLVDAGGNLVGVTTFKSRRAAGVGYAQMIERARQGPDAILSAALGEQPPSPAFAEVMSEQRAGRPEQPTDEDARDALRATVEQDSGALVIVETALVRPQKRHQQGSCPRYVRYPHRLQCLTDLAVRVVALTAKGKRPQTRQVDLRVMIGRRTSHAGIAATDSGWRSHKPSDPEAIAALDGLGTTLGLEVSVWSTTFYFEGPRVADLAHNSLDDQARIVIVYGDRQTDPAPLAQRVKAWNDLPRR